MRMRILLMMTMMMMRILITTMMMMDERVVMGSRHHYTAGAVTKGMWRPRVRKPDNAMHCVALDLILYPSALQQYIRFYIAVHYIIAVHCILCRKPPNTLVCCVSQ